MYCAKCGAKNVDEARFCASCGAAMEDDEVQSGSAGQGEAGAAHAAARSSVFDDSLRSGDNLGPYVLRGELGRGAMARVWRAWDPNLEREVAIKEPLFDPRLEEGVLEEMGHRFVKEGRTAARLQHPNIVAIYAADVYDGHPAIVMELVSGATLGDILENGPLDPKSSLDALDQLLEAVGYAHSKGVVHRDIKPDNVFVSDQGEVKLADFGIARVEDASATRATMVGSVLGTPGYMSPEQATGATVDSRSDLFSIGVVGYEMLTGKNPFGAGAGADSTTLLYRIVHEPAPELPSSAAAGLPVDLRPAIMAALAKSPDDRPQTAADFKAMLHGQVKAPTARMGAAPAPASSGLAGAVSKTSGGTPKWLPYVIVAAVCVVVLAAVLFFALSGGNGGGADGGNGGGTASTNATSGNTATVNSPYYLGVKDGKVVVYSNSSTEPFEVTDIDASLLPSEDQSKLNDHPGYSTYEEAKVGVKEFEDKAKAEADRKAAEEKAKAEEAARFNTVTLTVVGADGTTRSADIRRQGSTERVIPDSNSRLISYEEAAALSDAERCIAWNEIIASSNGYPFKNSGLAGYFGSCSWYHRVPGASASGNISGNANSNINMLKSMTDSWWFNLATY